MVTKVLIDLNTNKDSVIRISNLRDWVGSDDIRDKLVKMFVESLNDRLAIMTYESAGDEAIVKPASLEAVLSWLLEQFEETDGNHQLVQDIIDNVFGSVKAG